MNDTLKWIVAKIREDLEYFLNRDSDEEWVVEIVINLLHFKFNCYSKRRTWSTLDYSIHSLCKEIAERNAQWMLKNQSNPDVHFEPGSALLKRAEQDFERAKKAKVEGE